VSLDDDVVADVDRGAIRQVLINLLDNAVKYGPTGQTISVGLDRGSDQRLVRIWVEDEGPGIPAAERERIWEPFHRLDRDANSAIAGSGIGLALVRNLTVAHSGRVFVVAGTAGAGGSRFTIELPCTPPSYLRPTQPTPVGTSVPAYRGADEPVVTGR
jgi:signal transduction histidine kinase